MQLELIINQKKVKMISRIFELLNIFVLSTNTKYEDYNLYKESKAIRRELDTKQSPHVM